MLHIQTITIAAMEANYIGGWIRACVIESKGVEHYKIKHVLENLSTHYNAIAKKLELTKKVICLTIDMLAVKTYSHLLAVKTWSHMLDMKTYFAGRTWYYFLTMSF